MAIARLSQALVESEQMGGLEDDDGDSCRAPAIEEEEEEEEEEEAAAAPQAVMSGVLTKKTGPLKRAAKRYCVIDGGTMSWYKSEADLTSPVGYVTLADCTIAVPSAAGKKGADPRAFSVVVDGKPIDFEAETADACRAWAAALQHHMGMQAADGFGVAEPSQSSDMRSSDVEPSAPKAKAKKEKSGKGMVADLRLRAQKRVASKAITSDLGKKLLKEFCAPETFVLLAAVQAIA